MLCGDVHYNAYFDSALLTSSSQPMSYDTLTRTFEIYSEDDALIGFKSIEVQGFFVDHPLMTSEEPKEATQIEITNACNSPASLTAPSQPAPKLYYYTEGGATVYINSLVVYPPVCEITYECVSVDSMGTANTGSDVQCSDPGTLTFDPATGRIFFESTDINAYRPG